MKKFLSIIILLCVGIAYGQDDPNILNTKIAQLEKTIARQERIIEKLNTKIAEQEKETKRLLALCRQNRIETNPKKMARQPKNDGIAKRFEGHLEVGQIAYLGELNDLRITHIIDKQNAIVDFRIWIRLEDRYLPRSGPIDKEGHIYRDDPYTETVWVRGISTTNLVDGSYIKTDKPLKVAGTKTYDTASGGTKTVFLIEPYEPSQDSNKPNQ